MKKKYLVLMLVLTIFCASAGVGTYAWFTAKVTSTDNVYAVGDLELMKALQLPAHLFYTNPLYDGDTYAIGYWCPGMEVNTPNRHIDIRNMGSLQAKVYGISADMPSFINPFKNPNAEDEFTSNMIITVKNDNNVVVFTGSLKSLLTGTQLLAPVTILEPTGYTQQTDVIFHFAGKLSEAADNDCQGVTANVDLIFHATQVDGPTI